MKAKPPAVRVLFRVMSGVGKFFCKAFKVRLGKVLFKSAARELGLLKLRSFISGGGPMAKEIIDGREALGHLPRAQAGAMRDAGLSHHAREDP